MLKALRAHDEQLGEELDELRRRLGARRSPTPAAGQDQARRASRAGRNVVRRAFNTRLVEQTTASWEFWFGLLHRFVARERHAQVPGEFKDNGYRLGGWVGEQRKRYNHGLLPAERIRRLEQVGGLDLGRSGRVLGSRALRVSKGMWTARAIRGCRRCTLKPMATGLASGSAPSAVSSTAASWRRSEARGSLGCLTGAGTHREAWERGYERLMLFVAEHGDAIVPKGFVDADGRLDLWVLHQREAYRRGKKLSADQIRRLNEIPGWTWGPLDAAFGDGVARIEEYAQRHA